MSKEIVEMLEEISSKKAEIVDQTPFDLFEDNLALQVIEERLQSIYSLIESNPDLTREYVEEAILPIQDQLDNIEQKINKLLPQKPKKRTILPLRDPVYTDLLKVFFNAAGSSYKRQKDLKIAQLQIAYTILFYVGIRVNEMRFFTQKDIENAISTSEFNITHYKQKEAHIHVISDLAVQELKDLKNQLKIVFDKYRYRYLFGKNKPVGEKHLIYMINADLKKTCEISEIPYNIKSHSFRINMISRLLQNTTIQDAADIIGHKDIKSTIAYKRYALNKKEIQKLLNKIDNSKNK